MDDAGIKVNVNLEVKFNSQDFKLIDEGSNSVQLQRIRQEHELGPIKVTAQVELIWKEKNTIVVADLTQGFAAVQTSTVESVENRIVLSDKQKEALQNILELRVPTQEPPAKRPRRKCVAAYKASNSSNTSPSVPVRVPVFYGARKAPPYTWPSNTPMRRTIWQELNLEKNISGLKKQWASLSLATPEYSK